MKNRDYNIEKWQKIFENVYFKADEKRSPENLWVGLTSYAGSIGEAIRKMHFRELRDSLATFFCWLCSFISKCNSIDNDFFHFTNNLSEIIAFKYPLECGTCGNNPCQCSPEIEERRPNKSAQYKNLYNDWKSIKASVTHYKISDWVKQFYKIYGRNTPILTIETIGFHFIEEVGEASTYIRNLSALNGILKSGINNIDKLFLNELSNIDGIVKHYDKLYSVDINTTSANPEILMKRIVSAKINMLIEIADMFSWFVEIINKIKYISKNCDIPETSIIDVLSKKYFDINGNAFCPTCGNNICKCIFYM